MGQAGIGEGDGLLRVALVAGHLGRHHAHAGQAETQDGQRGQAEEGEYQRGAPLRRAARVDGVVACGSAAHSSLLMEADEDSTIPGCPSTGGVVMVMVT